MKKTTYQQKDYSAVFFGKCHNFGAGGVDILAATDELRMTRKRFDQKMKRSFRALGL